MKVKSLLSAFQKLKEQSKNGLLIHTLRNGLTRTGINLDPYVITVESLKFTSLPEIKDDASLYVVKQVDDDVIREIFEKMRWHTGELNTILALEHFSFVLYKQEQVAAFMMAWVNQYCYKTKLFKLESHQAYLDSMFTFDEFRGKNLAPYLRYKCYELLTEKGYTEYLSITQYFNYSSLKYKAKINAKYKGLYLYMGFFNRFRRIITLKTYKY
ncbi:MAG: hypothetical protein RLZZ241_1318 [Bacteroidota bacterium]|jgi:GNAT superfamily N-acetyltransferase